VTLASAIAESVRSACAAGRFPIVLGGNCAYTVGAVAGVPTRGLGVVWLDAHGDLNTPATSPTGFLDGMAAAMLLGWCHTDLLEQVPGWRAIAPDHLVSVGGRAFDPGEKEHAERHGVRFVPPELVTGEPKATGHTTFLHIDLDVLDPADVGPANPFAEPGGLKFHDVLRVVHEIAAGSRISGVTISAYDPAIDETGGVGRLVGPLLSEVIRCNAEHGRLSPEPQ
jgi:arginase